MRDGAAVMKAPQLEQKHKVHIGLSVAAGRACFYIALMERRMHFNWSQKAELGTSSSTRYEGLAWLSLPPLQPSQAFCCIFNG